MNWIGVSGYHCSCGVWVQTGSYHKCWWLQPWPAPEKAVTADEVRRIVREEVRKALAEKEGEVWKPPARSPYDCGPTGWKKP